MRAVKRRSLDEAARKWGSYTSFERDLEKELRKVSREIGKILKGATTPEALRGAESRLLRYAELLEPWADEQAERMIFRVFAANERRWSAFAREQAFDLKSVIVEGDLSATIQRQIQEAAGYIKSLPEEEALRVETLAQEALMYGLRPEEIQKKLEEEEGIASNRAALIARTEVSRANTILVAARAQSIGSEGYIWRTAHDGRVRESHLEMDGKFVYWSNPPELDGMTGHAGEFPNCRCIALPVL